MATRFNILCIGDIVGRPGREVLARVLPHLKKEHAADFVIANGENASGGCGLLPKNADEIYASGVDVITLGDHTWDKPEVNTLWEKTENLVRPYNFPPGALGRGVTVVKAANGHMVAVINMMGRTFMKYQLDCPFRAVDNILNDLDPNVKIRVIDFHAETTSEKNAFGVYTDGRVSAVFGTHTHIQTADARIFPQGTAFITDLGMTGPYDSVIGQNKDKILKRFLTSLPQKFEVAADDPMVCGALIVVDTATGKALSITNIAQRG